MADPLHMMGILLLLGIANGAPIIARSLLGGRLAVPLDGGLVLPDGRPLFGDAKTVRGVLAAVACTALAARLLGMSWVTGAALGALAMAGDLVSSFLKRRLGLPPHARAFGLDQLPEALLPLLALHAQLGIGSADIAVLAVAFLGAEILLSRLLFALGIRERPY